MKIGYDAKRAFENNTGLGNYSRMLIELVAKEKHKVYLFSAKHKPIVDWTPPSSAELIHPNFNFPLWRTLGMTSQIKSSEIDLYHGLSHELPFNIQSAKLPKVVTMHDCIFHHFPDSYTWIDRKIYDRKWRNAIIKADKIIAISQSTADDLIKFYDAPSKKIEVIHLFSSDLFHTKADNTQEKATLKKFHLTQPFFLFVGGHHPRKNLELVIQTYTQTKKDIPPVFVMGGKRKLLADFVKRQNLSERILIPKQRVNHRELAHLYRAATALIYPSHYEGFGLPVLEAMNSGTPVITSYNSSLKEVGGEAVLYTSPEGTQELANHIEQLTNDAALRKELREKGLHQAKRFSKEKHKNRLLSVYSDLIG